MHRVTSSIEFIRVFPVIIDNNNNDVPEREQSIFFVFRSEIKLKKFTVNSEFQCVNWNVDATDTNVFKLFNAFRAVTPIDRAEFNFSYILLIAPTEIHQF